MSSTHLTTYLNDHLAGSVAALQLVEHLAKLRRGTDQESIFQDLHAEIEEDQTVLREMLESLGAKESRMRKAAAFLTEKLGQAKLALDDPGDGDLHLLEALETLGLGIQGKLALWRSLARVAGSVPQLRTLPLDKLERRAQNQFQQVETQRVRAAEAALTAKL
jgi:hypothetical protein